MKLNNIKKNILRITIFLAVIAIWQLICILFNPSSFLLPRPFVVIEKLYNNFWILLPNLFVTLVEVVISVACSLIIGIGLSYLIDRYNRFGTITKGILIVSQTIPLIILAPLFNIWFGVGMFGKIIMVILLSFFTITNNINGAFENINENQTNLFKVLNASQKQTFWNLKIPHSIPSLFSGLKLVTTYAISLAIIAEIMGSKAGIGYFMSRAYSTYDMASIWGITLITICITLIMLAIINTIQKKYFNKYYY